ncbi:hypothetical protein ACIOJE_35120 [Kitasatospora sp. NPDC087861]|uniref:hypothetical protein n=1 Tax=Kitasatospora sp. NPDC087861 TaxID=3364070 RepID=UPI0037F56D66
MQTTTTPPADAAALIATAEANGWQTRINLFASEPGTQHYRLSASQDKTKGGWGTWVTAEWYTTGGPWLPGPQEPYLATAITGGPWVLGPSEEPRPITADEGHDATIAQLAEFMALNPVTRPVETPPAD